MKILPEFGLGRHLDQAVRRLRERGESAEAVTAFLRSVGCSPIVCIRLVSDTFGIGIGEAKRVLHDSPAWEDVSREQEAMWARVADWVEAGMPDVEG